LSSYIKSTNFTSKDSLPSGAPLKIIKGAEFDTEFNAVATAVNSKADLDSPTFTGTPTAPTPAAGASNSQIATMAALTAALGAALPAGVVLPYGGSTAPTGYLLCDGSAVSRTTYSALYTAIGTTYGAGNGSTTFNLPNGKGRMPMGADTGFALGTQGGSKDAAVIAHTHTASTTITDPGHAHALDGQTVQGSTVMAPSALTDSNARPLGTATFNSTTGITATTTVNSAGTSGTNANLPPYFVVNHIIKT
jgi:microcystin-dependent protein